MWILRAIKRDQSETFFGPYRNLRVANENCEDLLMGDWDDAEVVALKGYDRTEKWGYKARRIDRDND